MLIRYDVVLSDPPWSYSGAQDKWGAASKFYQTHSDEVLHMIARPPLNDPGVLFLWTSGPKMNSAIHLIESWGLHYRSVGFVWVKTNKEGVPWKARGVRPSVTKQLTEFVLVASTRAKGRPLKIGPGGEAVVQTVFAPVQEHSRKPDAVQKRIDVLYPGHSKLEMFARRARAGWDVHGDEAPHED